MSIEVKPASDDTWKVILANEPSYIHALEMAPASREPTIEAGAWLIVTFPIWSGPARHSVLAAIACAKKHDGRFELGIRPYDFHQEFDKWWPRKKAPGSDQTLIEVRGEPTRQELHISTDPRSNPVWLVLKDGKACYEGAGPRSSDELGEIMRAVLLDS